LDWIGNGVVWSTIANCHYFKLRHKMLYEVKVKILFFLLHGYTGAIKYVDC
jgi:hypothetical protein